MLKKHAQLFRYTLLISDLLIITISWILAYYLRFYTNIIPPDKGIPQFKEFLNLLFILLPINILVFRATGLYSPMRINSRFQELLKVFNGSVLSLLIFISLVYLFEEYKYSRVVFSYYLIISAGLISLTRTTIRSVLVFLRKKGFNLRYVLVIGAGKVAEEFYHKINDHPEFGLKIIGFLSNYRNSELHNSKYLSILGNYKDAHSILRRYTIDQVVIALQNEELRLINPILGDLREEMVELRLIPDFNPYFTLRKSIDDLDGMPIINLRESPMYGLNEISKRIFDLIFSFIFILILSPLMVIVAMAVKFSSPGPVFFKQTRVGMDGKKFKILKFRSMMTNAEIETGPIRAIENDPRRTKLGIFLRKYSLDELPQFFNVLFGEMSLVGPRPERQELMVGFIKQIPEYMLRHKVKAGITGWAQINGLRGNTSIAERTKYDFYYIEHWSLLFDLKIILRSAPFLTKKNAY